MTGGEGDVRDYIQPTMTGEGDIRTTYNPQ